MEMIKTSSSISTIFFLLLISSTSLVRSQSDSCSSQLGVTSLIPFNTSSLTCVSAWNSESFILRYSKAGPSLWNFVLSAPDTGAYIAIGFSPNGRMIGSSAMAGWMSGGAGFANQYSLGGYTSTECPPDQGSLPLVKGSSLLVSQSSRLYLAFQLNAAQPRQNLVYAVGPSNTSPSTGGAYLPTHRNMASGTLSAAAGGGGEDSGEDHEHGAPTGDGGSREGSNDGRSGTGGFNSVAAGPASARENTLLLIIAVLLALIFVY